MVWTEEKQLRGSNPGFFEQWTMTGGVFRPRTTGSYQRLRRIEILPIRTWGGEFKRDRQTEKLKQLKIEFVRIRSVQYRMCIGVEPIWKIPSVSAALKFRGIRQCTL